LTVFKKKRSSKNSTVVGLELDPSHVAAAEVTVNGSITVTRGAVAPLAPGVIRDGEVADAQALADTLKALFAEHDLPRRVRLGVSNQRIVVRALDLPPLDDPKELASAVRVEAPDHIPMPMDEAILDFQPLGKVVNSAGQERSRVVVVAVRREMIDRIVGAARQAGLQLEGIDLSAFAMVRAVGKTNDDAVLYVNVAGLINVAVANGSGCLFTRAAAGGLNAMVHTLCERGGLTTEHAREWLKHVGLARPVEEIEGDEAIIAATRQVLEEGAHELADTLRNSLNFYRTQESSERVERGVLTGPVVEIPGFVERLSTALRLPLEPAAVEVAEDLPSAALLTVAAGLAVEARP
jgi:type IV pilus assembly protein PilM